MVAHRFPGPQVGTDVICIADSPLPYVQNCIERHEPDKYLISETFVACEPRVPASAPPDRAAMRSAQFGACASVVRTGFPGGDHRPDGRGLQRGLAGRRVQGRARSLSAPLA
eukprot:14187201-Alexandrium_andersonii.AAC.1